MFTYDVTMLVCVSNCASALSLAISIMLVTDRSPHQIPSTGRSTIVTRQYYAEYALSVHIRRMSSDEEIDGAEDGDFEDDGDFEMDEVEEEDDEGTGAVDDLDGDEDASREAEDVSHFSKPSVKDPRSNTERGEAVRTQLALWDGLLETRIKIQKPLSVCNTLPHPTNSALFVDRIDEASRKQIDDVLHELRGLLAELGELHSVFLKGNYTVLRSSSRRDSDEEIESDTEDDEAEDKSVYLSGRIYSLRRFCFLSVRCANFDFCTGTVRTQAL
ncbi:hypothetical protein RvY_14540-2 [Ramazzottius varieornatus]|uniref:AATF leucine zipper-containing domain-containing protein n=1 Tax=Ramazzottius varieornatus TaxID=947166 RepID=A0A1D1VWS0_RAMVA|nr:hypothetical protein RvY_14540-2 [Ramazzottius varieornatus]